MSDLDLCLKLLAERGQRIRENIAASKAFAGTPEAADEKQNPIKDVAISNSTREPA